MNEKQSIKPNAKTITAVMIFVILILGACERKNKTHDKPADSVVKTEKIFFDKEYEFEGDVMFKSFLNTESEKITVPVLKFNTAVMVFNEENKNIKFAISEIQITSAKYRLDKELSGKKVKASGVIVEQGAGKNHIGPFILLIRELNIQ